MDARVTNNEAFSRYELRVDGRLIGVADYERRGSTFVFLHTEIDPVLRGRGYGAVLVRHALDDVRRAGGSVVPQCWFVAQFIREHPEYSSLVTAA